MYVRRITVKEIIIQDGFREEKKNLDKKRTIHNTPHKEYIENKTCFG